MKIASLLPYYGAKRTLAHRIIAQLGKHAAYWEPFCGSMAVLLAKPPAAMETVNDLFGDLINLARVIQDEAASMRLYRSLRRTLMHETLMEEAAQRFKERGYTPAGVMDWQRAYDYFLCAWMGRNGVAGTGSFNQGFCVRYTKNGGHAAKRWESVVASIPAWRERRRGGQ